MKQRIKFCDWKKVKKGGMCPMILTEKQFNYCKAKKQPFLCWSHQKENELLKLLLIQDRVSNGI